MCALAPDGHMALAGPCNEVVTLGILRGLQPPAPLRGLYDRDLSEASLAAAQAIADLQEKHEPWSGVVPNDAAVTNAAGSNITQPTLSACRLYAVERCPCQPHWLRAHLVSDQQSKSVDELS